nr:putative porin [Burkholderia sp. WAC0059]
MEERNAAGSRACGRIRLSRTSLAILALSMAAAPHVHAQSLETQAAEASANAAATPTGSTVINLIKLLVKRGVLTQQNATELIAEAQNEASQTKAAPSGAAGGAGAQVVNAPTQPGDVAVPYVPQVVRDQIRDEVKQEVVSQAKAENWAQPNTFPDWVSRITINGDVRVRDQFDFYSPRNVTGLTNFAAINKGSPVDINPNTNTSPFPTQNTTHDRDDQLSIRARLGVTAVVSDQLTAGLQLASGNDDGPVSTTSLLGGGFAKNDIWLNQAYLKYKPVPWIDITAGRFDNPFFSSDLLYSNDLQFDGIAASFRHLLPGHDNVTLFGTLGVFPIQYSSDSFLAQNPDTSGGTTQWMAGGQFGAEWQINDQNRLKGAVAYYDFMNMKGQLSAPCALYLGATSCSTDNEAPAFMQKGNTLVALRNIIQNPNLAPGDTPDPQYFGLAYNYRILDTKLEWDTKLADRYKIRLDGEYVRNLAYNSNKAFAAGAAPVVNNFNNASSSSTTVTQADYRSGANGFMFKATLGEPDTLEKGQWNFSVTYKYLQPDAVLDAFVDPDFDLGGTNTKGYIIGAQYAVARDAWLQARWMSAHEVYGPPLTIDVLQLEMNARF